MSKTSMLAASALLLFLAAGCGGSGSSVGRLATPPASGNPAPASIAKSNASAKIVIHPRSSKHAAAHANRKRQYVASTTQGAIATFVDTGNANASTSQGYALQPNAVATLASPATCGAAQEDGSYTCTVYFNLSPTGGPYTTTITTYDAAQSGTTGTPVAASGATSAVALSTDTESVAVTANQDNPYDFDLQGIVASLVPTPQYVGVNGTASPSPPAVLNSTFVALDGDGGEIDSLDSTSNFAVGKQPSGPFTENASLPVSVSDENTCASAPCLTTTSTAVANPASEQTAFSYNGMGGGGDGVSTPPYYGVVSVSAPTGFTGSVSAYVVPFFGFVDSTSAYASGSSGVSFVSPSNSITIYAAQYHLPDGASGYAADTSACGSGSAAIATASAGTNDPGYGASFTLSAGTASGTCSVTLSDGAGDSATIAVTSTAGGNSTVTVPCGNPVTPNARHRAAATTAATCSPSLVQYATGDEFVSLPNPVRAGDTLVLLIQNGPSAPTNYPSAPFAGFGLDSNATDDIAFVYTQDIASAQTISNVDAGQYSAYWIGEFSGTSAAAIQSAAYASDQSTIVPDVSGATLVGEEFGGSDQSATGFTTYVNDVDASSPLQAALYSNPSVAGSQVTFPFDGTDQAIVEVPPASFRGSFAMRRLSSADIRAMAARRGKKLPPGL